MAGMGSSKAPPPPQPAPPPVRETGADRAQAMADTARDERKRYDYAKTILRSGQQSPLGPTPTGTRQTLG
jgi:hypothetical protein